MANTPHNTFLDGSLTSIYVKTSLPIIFVMGLSGLHAVVDAIFLGHYTGPEALAAVTLMFPIYMLIVALSTLVSSGMSSILARHLGGKRLSEARAIFAGAHGLALIVGGVLILLFLLFGHKFAFLAARGSNELAEMGLIYLRIMTFFSPLLFVLSVNSDTLRNEGRLGFMAAMSLLVSLANIGFNYVLIGLLDMGVAGSAYGTVLAQTLALGIIVAFRLHGNTVLRASALLEHSLTYGWLRILAFGTPQSLSFIGLALGSAVIMAALQLVDSTIYESTVSAYGIITRVMTFAFLPLLGLSHAMQTITGNNYGAGLLHRSNLSLKFAIFTAFIYCAIIQLAMTVFASQIGRAFVIDPLVVSEVARILPIIVTMFAVAGPLMMIATYFQAIGDTGRAIILSLSKPYLFAIPATFILSATIGEKGIWITSPFAEAMLLILTTVVLAQTARSQSLRWGLFKVMEEDRT